MEDLESRKQKAIEEITGNEALLEMLDTEPAAEMLEWGKSMVVSVVDLSDGREETAEDETLESRLKAVRQFMRSVGNWAAGKYTEPESRIQLRDKLLGQYQLIAGENTRLPSPDQMDAVLNQVDDRGNTPQQLILHLKNLLNEPG